MLLEVSSGEGFDKLSILEIKYNRIASPEKRDAVQKEIQALSSVSDLKAKYPIEYESLKKVNEEIWDLTETLDPISPLFAKVSERIFDLNRKRFRVKRMINTIENSNLKEQKSTGSSHCVIELDVDPYSRISEIYSIAFDYDTFSFDRPCKLRPFSNFLDSAPEPYSCVVLSSIPRISENVRPISYGCGGKIGDTIHQFSVVNETYLLTGRKGIIYLSDELGDTYERGVIATYEDIREVLASQVYIHSVSVHRGENYDVNLSEWRAHETGPAKSWSQAFQTTFNVPWNTEPWMNVTPNLQYRDTVFLSVGIYRYNHVLRYKEIVDRIPNIAFLCTHIEVYETFVSKTGVQIPYLLCPTFTDLASVLAGCKGLIGSLSMPLALADAMWKPRLAILYGVDYVNTIAMLTDNRFLLYTEDLDAFGWTVPDHLQSIVK